MNGSRPQNDDRDLDALFLEALSYHGPLTPTDLIKVGLGAEVGSEDTQRWLVSAAKRGLIQRVLSNRPGDTWALS